MGFQRTVLPSGVRVLSDVVPGQRSVSLGAWLGTGSRDEPEKLGGVTHFLEHLVFKGTPSRTALDIAESFDAIGGDINAFTTKEFTCFHTRTLGEDLPLCIDTIADIVRNATLAPGDVEAERSVVLEEISMHDDTPDDHVFDLFASTMFPAQPLGRPVQGDQPTIAALSHDDIARYHADAFAGAELTVAAAGAVDHGRLVELVARGFEGDERRELLARSAAMASPQEALGIEERDIEQVHLVYGTPGIPRGDDRRWALEVLNVAFGGGMSSRLSQEIREKRGLVYTISSGHSPFAETGMFTIYAGCTTLHLADVLSLVREQIEAVASKGITDEERLRAIGHLRGSLLLSLDDPGARMSHLGKSDLLLREILSPDEMIARVEAVTTDAVRAVAEEILGSGTWSLALLGPVDGADAGALMGSAA